MNSSDSESPFNGINFAGGDEEPRGTAARWSLPELPNRLGPHVLESWGAGVASDQRSPLTVQTDEVHAPVNSERASRVLRWSAVLVAAGAFGVGLSAYGVLASVDIVGFILGDGELYSGWMMAALAAGSLIALIAFALSIVSILRSRTKVLAVLVLIGAVFLPAATFAWGVHEGGETAYAQTLSAAVERGSSISPEELQHVFNQLESVGIDVPGSEDIVNTLKSFREALPSGPNQGSS